MIPLSYILSAALAFVSDMDGTLVHYNSTTDPFDRPGLVTLPASSTGRVGVVSQRSLDLLSNIRDEGIVITCASGMRVSTMMTRQRLFPAVKFWICENGGRIFEVKGNQELCEVNEWKLIADQDDVSAAAMTSYKTDLRGMRGADRDFQIDESGYETMIRIKALKGDEEANFKLLSKLAERVPKPLKVTYNLGHLDVCYPHTGKLSAIRWLLATRPEAGRSRQVTNVNIEDANGVGKVSRDAYLYMGDDDNDVEAGRVSDLLFVTRPCSEAMRTMAEERMSQLPGTVSIADLEGSQGTELLLEEVLATVRRRKKT